MSTSPAVSAPTKDHCGQTGTKPCLMQCFCQKNNEALAVGAVLWVLLDLQNGLLSTQ